MEQKHLPTIEEIQKSFDAYKKENEEKLKNLQDQLVEKDKRIAQLTIMGVTTKVKTDTKEVNDEPVTFDFDF